MSPKNNLYSFQEAKGLMAQWIKGLKSSTALERLEIKIHPVAMLPWLSAQECAVKIYGSNQSDTMAIAGLGEAVCIKGQKKGDLTTIFKQLRSYLVPRFPYLQWYGGFCFDDRHLDGPWKEFGAYRFVLPRFELAALNNKMIFACNILPGDKRSVILRQLKNIKISGHLKPMMGQVRHRQDQPNYQLWEDHVASILRHKTVKKVVLARKTSLDFEKPLNPWAMMRQLKKVTPNSYHFVFQFKNNVFLGASPERLYQRQGKQMASEALAGSVARRVDPECLRLSQKNRYEHELVIDAIRDVCKNMCKKFHYSRSPGILTLSNGHHLITKFQGQLKDSVRDEDILQCLHPTPALGGSPRKPAMDIIRRREGFSRGWYGAPVGYVGLDRAEFVVGIRSGLISAKRLSVFAGAGIVAGSTPQAEWDEIENKISNFIKIIGP